MPKIILHCNKMNCNNSYHDSLRLMNIISTVVSALLIIAMKTKSFIAFRQWIGRALRPSNNFKESIIIDNVYPSNILSHGMPDDNIQWKVFEYYHLSGKKCTQKSCFQNEIMNYLLNKKRKH